MYRDSKMFLLSSKDMDTIRNSSAPGSDQITAVGVYSDFANHSDADGLVEQTHVEKAEREVPGAVEVLVNVGLVVREGDRLRFTDYQRKWEEAVRFAVEAGWLTDSDAPYLQ